MINIETAIAGKTPDASGEVRVNCDCEGGQKETMGVNVTTGIYHCHRCGVKGNFKKVNGKENKLFAQWYWEQACTVPEHPYPTRKQIHPTNIRIDMHTNWLTDYRDQHGNIQTVQMINPEKVPGKSDKYFLSKAKNSGKGFSGAAYIIDGNSDAVYVCEGPATGWSIHHATGATVYCVGGKENFKHVLPWVKAKHQVVVVAADNDKSGDGLKAAKKAAQENNLPLAYPGAPGQDFNDMAIDAGLDAVKTVLENAKVPEADSGPKIEIISLSEIIEIDPSIEFIVDGFLIRKAGHILHAAGGVGKSTIAGQIAGELARNRSENSGVFDEYIGDLLFDTFHIVQHCMQSLFIQSENSMATINTKMRWLKDDPAAGRIFFPKLFDDVITTGEAFTDDVFLQRLTDTIHFIEDQTSHRLDIVWVDPLISFHKGDENAADHMRAALDGVTKLMQMTNTTAVVLHHDNRMGDIRGSGAIDQWARSRMQMKQVWIGEDRIRDMGPDGPIKTVAKVPAVELHHHKANDMARFDKITLAQDRNLMFQLVDDPIDQDIATRSAEVAKALNDMGGYAESNRALAKTVSELTGRSTSTCKRDIAGAVKHGFILQVNNKSGNANSYGYQTK
jgi:hypothetical protein